MGKGSIDEPLDFLDNPQSGGEAAARTPRAAGPTRNGTRRLIIAVMITALVAGGIGYEIGRNSAQNRAVGQPTASSSSAPTTPITVPSGATPTVTTSPPLTTPGSGTQETTSANPGPDYLDLLAALEIKGRAPKTGYDRLNFGEAWLDVDGNNCRTRDDILRRDLINVVPVSGCAVTAGLLHDPYTGNDISFVYGEETSSLVQIDHVVPLLDAWVKGAQQWTLVRREEFANDPLNLLAVDGSANQQKGAGDAATWLPPNKSYRCDYAARIVAVKYKYGVWTTGAENDALKLLLLNCDRTPTLSP